MTEIQGSYLKEQLPLYHATTSFDKLEKILKGGFRPSYCEESISTDWNKEQTKTAAEPFITANEFQSYFPKIFGTKTLEISNTISAFFPMVSFCSVRLEDACHRMKSYGYYGIALTREWGRVNGLNPVLYYERSAHACRSFVRSFFWLQHKAQNIEYALQSDSWISSNAIAIRSLVQTFAYAKNFYGCLNRNDTLVQDNYPFGYEREWRLWCDLADKPKFVAASGFGSNKQDSKNVLNSNIKERLKFLPSDIEAVYVSDDEEKTKMENRFPKIAGKVRINPEML